MDMMAALRDLDERELAALLAARPDLVAPRSPANLSELARRAEAWSSVTSAIHSLDGWCWSLVDALTLLLTGAGAPATVERLAGLLGPDVSAQDVSDGLGRLRAAGLVQLTGGRIEVAFGLRERNPFPAGLGRPLTSLLGRQSVSYLSAIAANLGIKGPTTKAKLLATLVQALREPAMVARALAGLEPKAAQLLSEVDESGYPTIKAPWNLLWQGGAPKGLVAGLMSRGLLVGSDWERVEVPREVGMALRGGRPLGRVSPRCPEVALRAVDPVQVEAGAARAAAEAVRGVASVLDELSARPASWLKAGGVGVRDIRRLAKVAGIDEPDAYLSVEVAAAAGLLALDAGHGEVLPTGNYDDWLVAETADRWMELATGWARSPRLMALAGCPQPDANDKPLPALSPQPGSDATRLRTDLLTALLEVPPGQAAEPASLASRLAWVGPGRWAEKTRSTETVVSWFVGEMAWLGIMADGALSGAARLACTTGLDAARRAAQQSLGAPVTQVTLQADLTAIASGELDGGAARELDLMADVESRGAATVWRFSEASVRRALDEGRDAQELIAFLAARATKGVPQPLAYLISDVGRRHGRLRVGAAMSYLRSEDPALLAEAVRSRRTARLGLHLLAPTVAVSSSPLAQVLAGLQAAGFLPAAEGADGALLVSAPRRRRAALPAGVGGAAGSALDEGWLGPVPTGAAPSARAGGRPVRTGGKPVGTGGRKAKAGADAVGGAADGPPQELVELANRLKATPMARPAARPTGGPRRAQAPSLWDGHEELEVSFDDPAFSPSDLITDLDGFFDLFADAIDGDYQVMIGYSNGRGDYVEEAVHPMALGEDKSGPLMMGAAGPRFDVHSYRLARIRWARPCSPEEVSA